MYQDLLPIGSIVKLGDSEGKVMICGRIAVESSSDDIYDYIGCMYPFGISAQDEMFFFNREAISQLFFIGYQDEQELIYRTEILDKIKELKVENGEIVPVHVDVE